MVNRNRIIAEHRRAVQMTGCLQPINQEAHERPRSTPRKLRLVLRSHTNFLRITGGFSSSKTGGRATRKSVEVGHRNALETEILRGLNKGEEAILHPSNYLKEGSAVSGPLTVWGKGRNCSERSRAIVTK